MFFFIGLTPAIIMLTIRVFRAKQSEYLVGICSVLLLFFFDLCPSRNIRVNWCSSKIVRRILFDYIHFKVRYVMVEYITEVFENSSLLQSVIS